jgi:hypothetical protein
MKDSDGVEINEGDVIHFTYGIPPVGVEAPIISRDGELIAITAGHNPAECKLSNLSRHIDYFWVEAVR